MTTPIQRTPWIISLLACIALATTGTAQNGASERHKAGTIVFDLTPHGITPPTITVSEGWYYINVRNGISLAELTVQLDKEGGAEELRTIVGKGKSGVQKPVLLPLGKHLLTVGQRAEWNATVLVTINSEAK